MHNHNFYSEFPRLAVVQVSMYWPQAEDSKKRLCVTPEGGMQAVPEWLLETEGSNLLRVLSDPEVDTRKTSTNHIVEIFSVSCASAVGAAILSCVFSSPFFFSVIFLLLLIQSKLLVQITAVPRRLFS